MGQGHAIVDIRKSGDLRKSGTGTMAAMVDGSSLFARHAELLSQVAVADKGAFAELFGFFGGRLNSYFRHLGLSDRESEILVEAVMLMVWRKAGHYDPAQSSVMAWIFSLARSCRIDTSRRQYDGDLIGHDVFGDLADVMAASQIMQSSWQTTAILSALADLPEQQVMVMRLAILDGSSHAMIANELAISVAEVRTQLRVGFHHLRTVLGDVV